VPLKTDSPIEDAVKYFTDIQWAEWTATPEDTIFIKQKLTGKRRLRKEWHRYRTPTRKNYSTGLPKSLNSSSMNTKIQHPNVSTRSYPHGLHRLLRVENYKKT
jgi:hypothetical protein